MKRSILSSIISLGTAAVMFLPLGSSIALADDVPQQAAVRSTLVPQQLDNLVAPLALYPDPLLSQVLVAATYPLEVVEAYQWLQQNRSLTGTALMDAAKTQNWDPSIQALVAFPDVLTRLNQDVRWTTDLGNAFLGQQADVMAAVQRLRVRAQANGKLQTTPQETVTTQDQNGQSAISIQPADPQVVYVPTYDPAYIWGAPAYGYYPPLFYPSYGFGFGFGIPIAGFWPGWGLGFGWGWGFNWFGGGLFVNSGFFNHYGYHLGGLGFRGGFAGNRAWAHDYARTARAGGARGYSRSYNSPASSFRSGANSFANRAGSNSFANRAGANSFANRSGSNSFANRAGANSFANRAGSNAFANRGYSNGAARSYSQGFAGRSTAPSRSYSAPSRSYSAPSRSYSSGGASRSFSGGGGSRSFGGGGGGSRGGGGGHGGGRR